MVVALGHTAADGATIRAAVAAGARLSTHLGNGIASPLPRHPNPIWDQAATRRAVRHRSSPTATTSTCATLRVLARAKGPARTILVSDASPLAGLPPGVYGEWAVDPSGKIVVAGTPYLAGSNQGLEIGLRNLLDATGWHARRKRIATVTTNPARLLGRPSPRLARRRAGDLVIFRRPRGPDSFVLERVCVRAVGTELERRAVDRTSGGRSRNVRTGRGWTTHPLRDVEPRILCERQSTQADAAGSLPSTQSPSSF